MFGVIFVVQVVLFDVDKGQVDRALQLIDVELRQFEKDGLLKGDISAEEQSKLITGSSSLEETVKVNNWRFVNKTNLCQSYKT